MPALPSPARRFLAPSIGALGATVLALAAGAPAAQAHGGATVVDGSSGGVTVLVQRAAAQTAGGAAAVDISTVLGGPGTKEASVDYWIRPGGGKTFKVETDRDEGGTFHADIATAGRGDATAWDLSAIVTLSSGKRLRVTTDTGNAPGPDPAARAQAEEEQEEAPTQPTLTEGNPPSTTPTPTTPEATGDQPAGDEDVSDISGEESGPPAWAFPSFLVLTIVGFAILAVKRRNLRSRDGGPQD